MAQDNDKEIAALKREVADLKKTVEKQQKQLAVLTRGIPQMEKKLNRTYHAQATTSNQLQSLYQQVQRIADKLRGR